MTDFSDFKAQIAEYANRQDWADAIVIGFIRQAEQKLNAELRVDRMIKFSQALINGRCIALPDDWLAMELIRIANPNVPSGFLPIRYKSRDEFYTTTDNWMYGFYTIQGRQLFIGGAPDAVNGQAALITYYGEVPVFSDTTPSWVYSKYPSLYLSAAMMHAFLHAVGEEDKAAGAKQLTEDTINKLNALHLTSRASGSRVVRSRVRSFRMKMACFGSFGSDRYGGARPGDRGRDMRLRRLSGRAVASTDHEPRRLSLRIDDDGAGTLGEAQGAPPVAPEASTPPEPPKPPTPLPEPKK